PSCPTSPVSPAASLRCRSRTRKNRPCPARSPTRHAASASRPKAATASKRRLPRRRGSNSSRRRASSSPDRSIWPARCWHRTAPCRPKLDLLLEHDPSGRARGHAFPKTCIHFSGSCPGRSAQQLHQVGLLLLHLIQRALMRRLVGPPAQQPSTVTE